MRQLSSLLLSATAILGANALDASIFTFDTPRTSPPLEDSRVSDIVASPLLALRTNSDDGFVLVNTNPETVQLLNQYGGTPSPLFGASRSIGNLRKSLIILEGISPEAASSVKKDFSGNLITSSLSPSLLDDDPMVFLRDPDPSRVSGFEERRCTFNANDLTTQPEQIDAAWECISKDTTFQEIPYTSHKGLLGQVQSVESWIDKAKSTTSIRISFKAEKVPRDDKLSKDALRSFFEDVSTSSNDGKEITLMLLPHAQAYKQSKRNSFPQRTAKKDTVTMETHSTWKRQDSQKLLTTLPVCHSSNSTCSEATGNCSGHGFCDKKYGTQDDGAASECYACKCQKTVEKKPDGTTRTVRWGGPACQKEDISSPFFLIAGITIMIMAAAGTAVGMLFGVGQEELPGVISAGVGSVRAQK